jgi:hypothetical protein
MISVNLVIRSLRSGLRRTNEMEEELIFELKLLEIDFDRIRDGCDLHINEYEKPFILELCHRFGYYLLVNKESVIGKFSGNPFYAMCKFDVGYNFAWMRVIL